MWVGFQGVIRFFVLVGCCFRICLACCAFYSVLLLLFFVGLFVCLRLCLELCFALFVVLGFVLLGVMVVWIGFDYFACFTLCVDNGAFYCLV